MEEGLWEVRAQQQLISASAVDHPSERMACPVVVGLLGMTCLASTAGMFLGQRTMLSCEEALLYFAGVRFEERMMR